MVPVWDLAAAGEAAFFAVTDFFPFALTSPPLLGVYLITFSTTLVVAGNLALTAAFLASEAFEAALTARLAAAPPLTLAPVEAAATTAFLAPPRATTAVEPSLNCQSSPLLETMPWETSPLPVSEISAAGSLATEA